MTIVTDSGDILHFLDICAAIEDLFAQLYRHNSRVYASSPDAARLWKKTALDEENHKLQAVFASRLLGEIEGVAPGVLERSQRLYRRMSAMLRDARNNAPTLEIALRNAIAMEEAAADLHVDSALSFKKIETQQFFRTMRDFDREHISALRRLAGEIMQNP